MTPKAPTSRKRFHGDWDEIKHLYDRIMFLFYECGRRKQALRYQERFGELLIECASDHEAVFGEECWSLLFELRGDLEKSIQHRENEIKLLERLLRITFDSEQLRKSTGYDYSDLADRLELLAILCHDAGRLDQAIDSLKKSRRICLRHKLPFDGRGLWAEYLAEMKKTTETEGR
jgi:tetratricopeptide (TPR) repeat protein